MIPLTCTVDDRTTGRTRTFHVRVVNHPLLAPMLIPIAADNAIFEVHPVPGDATALVDTEVQTEGFGTIHRQNEVFDPAAIDVAAIDDLSDAVNVLARNQFQRIPIKGLNLHVTIEAKRQTATIERIFVRKEKFEPGETIPVGVVLRPYRGEPFTTTAEIKIPSHATNGRAVLMVSGGPARLGAPGTVVVSEGGGGPSPAPSAVGGANATSVTQLLQQYLDRARNNQLVTRIVFAGPAVNVAGTTLSQLPSTLAEVMRSSKSSGLRTDRDQVKAIQDMDWLVSGAQTLPITIERKDQSESRTVESGTAKAAAAPTVAEDPVTVTPDATDASVEEESTTLPSQPATGTREAGGGFVRTDRGFNPGRRTPGRLRRPPRTLRLRRLRRGVAPPAGILRRRVPVSSSQGRPGFRPRPRGMRERTQRGTRRRIRRWSAGLLFAGPRPVKPILSAGRPTGSASPPAATSGWRRGCSRFTKLPSSLSGRWRLATASPTPAPGTAAWSIRLSRGERRVSSSRRASWKCTRWPAISRGTSTRAPAPTARCSASRRMVRAR